MTCESGLSQGACLESCEPLMNWVILMQGPDSVGGLHLYDNEVGTAGPLMHPTPTPLTMTVQRARLANANTDSLGWCQFL